MFACLETRARSEGYMVKIFKTWCLSLHWLGVTDLNARYKGG